MPNKFKAVKQGAKQVFKLGILNKQVVTEGIQAKQVAIHRMVAIVKLEVILTSAAKLVIHIINLEIATFQDKLTIIKLLNFEP